MEMIKNFNKKCFFFIVDLTPHQKGTQVGFWFPIKIPAEYVSLMPTQPENAKNKIFHGGVLTNKFWK